MKSTLLYKISFTEIFDCFINCFVVVLQVENLNSLGSLISSSTHDGLSSLWNQVVEPLVKDLYTKCPSSG